MDTLSICFSSERLSSIHLNFSVDDERTLSFVFVM